jgi:hypothetical protein
MMTVEFITALFYEVDEQLRTIPKHPEAHLWPSEVVTLGLLHAGVTGCPRRLHAANGSSPSSRVSIGSTNSRYGYKRWVSFSMRYRMKSSQSPLR